MIHAVDELQDVARSALSQGDRSVAMASVDALARFLRDYQDEKADRPVSWFRTDRVLNDPDFVALEAASLQAIDDERLWVEVKVLRQYLVLVGLSVPACRDVANLIAIRTRELGEACGEAPVLDLLIRCFNSYLRATLNARDPRTTYYLLNQYRLLAEHLLVYGDPALRSSVVAIAGHLAHYGQLAERMDMPFILEVAAHDLVQLIVSLDRRRSALGTPQDEGLMDELVELMLSLDRDRAHEESLLGVRRAQLQLAAVFAASGDELRVMRFVEDLKGETRPRLLALYAELMGEEREQYWEFTDRGVNFSYLPPALRRHLAEIYGRIGISVEHLAAGP